MLKKFRDNNIDSVYYEDLDNYDDDDDYVDYDDDKYIKIGTIRRLFKGFDRDYYKPIITDRGFGGRENNYIKYRSKRNEYKNLSPKKYLNLIRPYLRDLINEHKLTAELNDNNDNNNNKSNNNNNSNNNNSNNRTEWNIQLTMHISCISTKSFEDKRTMHPKSEPVEIFIGSNTKDVIDKLFNTLLQRFQKSQETSNERGSKFFTDSVELLYNFQRIGIRRTESCVMSLDWNVDTDSSSYQRDWEEFEQENNSIALNVLFVSHNSEEIKLAYRSIYNKRKN